MLDAVFIFTFDDKITSDRQMQFEFGISQLVRQLNGFPVTQHRLNLLISLSASSKIHFTNEKKNILAGGKVKSFLLKAYGALSREFCL